MDELTPDDELFAELGAALGLGARGMSARLQAALGRSWFSENLPRFREVLCGNERVKQLYDGGATSTEVAAVVADLLSASFTGLPIGTISVLIARYGLEKLCM